MMVARNEENPMKLYDSAMAPNPRRVRIFLAEKGITVPTVQVDIAKAADQNAFKYVWCPQHHFLDEYSHMPGPEAFLGHCAAITEQVHLGIGMRGIASKNAL